MQELYYTVYTVISSANIIQEFVLSFKNILVFLTSLVLTALIISCPAVVDPGSMDSEIGSVLLNLSSDSSIHRLSARAEDNLQFVFDHDADIETYENSSSGQSGGAIHLVLPPSSTADNITAYFELGEKSSVSPSGSLNLANVQSFLVKAEDDSERTYNFTYEIESSSGNEITGFMFKAAANSTTLYYDINADSIDSSTDPGTITVTVPNNAVPPLTAVTDFVPSFEITGSEFTVGGSPKKSGADTVSFNPTATVNVNGTGTKQYNITVNVLQNSAKEITSFMFRDADNTGISADYTGTVSGTDITVIIPSGDITNLVPYITHSPESSYSPVSSLDFTGSDTTPVPYTVTAEDGTTQVYNVYVVAVVLSSEKEITAFEFNTTDNPALSSTYTGTITGTDITLDILNTEDITSLTPTITASPLSSVFPSGAVDFTGSDTTPVPYTVTAEDGSTQIYNVYVTLVPPSSEKEITSFNINTTENPSLVVSGAVGSISGTNIYIILSEADNTASLIPEIFVSPGATVSPLSLTATDFSSSPVSYTVTAQDGSTQVYSVNVLLYSNAKEITAFEFNTGDNPSLGATYTGTITGNDIYISIPGTEDITSLTPAITPSPLAGLSPSGAVDFTGSNLTPVEYTVTAQDGTQQIYYVHVQSSSKEILDFKFITAANPSLPVDYSAVISGTNIDIGISEYATLSSLLPIITASPGATVTPAGANDFSSLSAPYTVKAEDGSEQIYNVNVTLLSSGNEITAVEFNTTENPSLSSTYYGSMIGNDIYFDFSDTVDITALTPTINASIDATVTPAGAVDFTGSDTTPVEYTVKAEDESEQVYYFHVNVLSSAKEITAFGFKTGVNTGLGADYTGSIGAGNVITVDLPVTEDITSLMPDITASAGVTITPAGFIDFTGSDTTPVMYTVKAEDNSTQVYSVSVNYTGWDYFDDIATQMSYSGTGAGLEMDINRYNDDIVCAFQDSENSNGVTTFLWQGGPWKNLGTRNFTGVEATDISLAVRNTAEDYFIANQNSTDGKLRISENIGYGAWTTVSESSADATLPPSDIEATSSSLFLIYRDVLNADQVTVHEWDGSSLQDRSYTGLMKSNATNRQNFKLTADNTETLYATYYDDSGSFVMQEYTGSSWDDAGSSDFSSVEPYAYFDVAAHQSLARIYCASVATNGVVYIRSKSGLSWNIFAIAASDADISTGAGNFIKLEVDSAGNVYLFYRDILGHPKLVKYDSSGNKVTVDGVVDDYINHHVVSYGNIAVDSSDKVYLAFQDDSDGQKIIFMTYTP